MTKIKQAFSSPHEPDSPSPSPSIHSSLINLDDKEQFPSLMPSPTHDPITQNNEDPPPQDSPASPPKHSAASETFVDTRDELEVFLQDLATTPELKLNLNAAMKSVGVALKQISIQSTFEVDELKARNADLQLKLIETEQKARHYHESSSHFYQELGRRNQELGQRDHESRAGREARSKIRGLEDRVVFLEQELEKRMREITWFESRSARAQEREIDLEVQLDDLKAVLPSNNGGAGETGPPLLSVRALSSVVSIGCFEAGFGSVEMRSRLGTLDQALLKTTALFSDGDRSYQSMLVDFLYKNVFEPGLLESSDECTIIPQNETWSAAIDLSTLVLRSARCRAILRGENKLDRERVNERLEKLIGLLDEKVKSLVPRGVEMLSKLLCLAAELWLFVSAAHPLLCLLVTRAGSKVEDKRHSVLSIQGNDGKIKEGVGMSVIGCLCPGIAFLQATRQEGTALVAKEKVIARYVEEDQKQPEEKEEVAGLPLEDPIQADGQSLEPLPEPAPDAPSLAPPVEDELNDEMTKGKSGGSSASDGMDWEHIRNVSGSDDTEISSF